MTPEDKMEFIRLLAAVCTTWVVLVGMTATAMGLIHIVFLKNTAKCPDCARLHNENEAPPESAAMMLAREATAATQKTAIQQTAKATPEDRVVDAGGWLSGGS